MARIANLHDAGRALAAHLRGLIQPALTDVLAAPPLDNPAAQAEAVRLSLLWVTPQPTHRNDPWVTGGDGQSRPPPVSLSAFYLVTAYGTSGAGEPTQAINRLGQALQAIETRPVIDLPIAASAGIDPVPGSGRLTIAVVPVAADLMEKIFTPLQVRHRPWALVELGPVQLDRLAAPRPAPDLVAPGGLRLEGPQPVTRPVIRAMHPAPLGAGRRLRLDTVEAGGATALLIGAARFAFADAPAGPDQIARPDGEGRVFATYPAASATGALDVILIGPDGPSERHPLTVTEAGLAALDAPLAPLPPGADLVLTGAGLATAERIFLWPERGIRSPAEVIGLAPAVVLAGQVSASRAALDAAGLRPIPHLVALRLDTGRFTPPVLLEIAP
ncbi:uncharacterized protein DUF4255 [Cereibacter ovatus]|uniref:Uncharacterized protein DUF4255 n=1 Tax=Cereibacter ovatus TaxID=439529 RepID=A0A285CT51_9RHOB|nr:Pvc16 family protein [Cereibacter ovatus]SNX70236.1 uncharacterized protein DUF4255 [Cereibacter ovatus]